MDTPEQCELKCCGRWLSEEVLSKLSFSKCSFWDADVSFDRGLFYDEAEIYCTEVLRQKSMYPSVVVWCCQAAAWSQSKASALFFLSEGFGKNFDRLMWGFSVEFIRGQTRSLWSLWQFYHRVVTAEPTTTERAWKSRPKLVAQPC